MIYIIILKDVLAGIYSGLSSEFVSLSVSLSLALISQPIQRCIQMSMSWNTACILSLSLFLSRLFPNSKPKPKPKSRTEAISINMWIRLRTPNWGGGNERSVHRGRQGLAGFLPPCTSLRFSSSLYLHFWLLVVLVNSRSNSIPTNNYLSLIQESFSEQ